MKIWERYFFFETLKVLFFFLFAFTGLFVLIDYASHTGHFHHHHIRLSFAETALYYVGELLQKSDAILPFACLVASIRVLTQLNVHNELVALLASGIKLKRLLRPFLWVGCLGVAFLYAGQEWLIPWSQDKAQALLEKHGSDTALKLENPAAHFVLLEDRTLMLYQTYSRHERRFWDAWWIPSIDHLVRIKTLELEPNIIGYDVETFRRLPSGILVSSGKKDQEAFPHLHFNEKRLLETLTQPEDLSLSELASRLPKTASSEKEARIETAFYRKLFLPWLALFAIIGPAPFCLVFTRNLNLFLIYAASFFALFFLYVLFSAATTLAERQLISPFTALFTPFFFTLCFLTRSWSRL